MTNESKAVPQEDLVKAAVAEWLASQDLSRLVWGPQAIRQIVRSVTEDLASTHPVSRSELPATIVTNTTSSTLYLVDEVAFPVDSAVLVTSVFAEAGAFPGLLTIGPSQHIPLQVSTFTETMLLCPPRQHIGLYLPAATDAGGVFATGIIVNR